MRIVFVELIHTFTFVSFRERTYSVVCEAREAAVLLKATAAEATTAAAKGQRECAAGYAASQDGCRGSNDHAPSEPPPPEVGVELTFTTTANSNDGFRVQT